jgi:alpha-methylacyl-CoA racemase
MVDGSALLTAFLHGLLGAGRWPNPRGENLLDGGAPFYDTYRTADGGFMAVGALEPPFYAALLAGLDLTAPDPAGPDPAGPDPAGPDPAGSLPAQFDRAGWPVLRARFAERFAARSRAEWTEVFAGLDACVAPVLSPAEAPDHPHNRARQTFVDVDGAAQPAPAPRFGRTPAPPPRPAVAVSTEEIVAGWPLAGGPFDDGPE